MKITAIPKMKYSVNHCCGGGGHAAPVFFPEEKGNAMFKFELLVGSNGWHRMMEKITDLAAEGKEVFYNEAPGKIQVPNPDGGEPIELQGIIATGYATP